MRRLLDRLVGGDLRRGAPIRNEVPLAWRSLTANRRHLARAAAGIAFAILLVLVQLAVQAAFIDSALEVIRRIDGDLVMISSVKQRWTQVSPFPAERLAQALAMPGVHQVAPLYQDLRQGVWKNPHDRSTSMIQVLAVDPDKPVFDLPDITAGLAGLKEPGTVLVDARSRGFLGPGVAGMETELNGRAVRIIGSFPLGPDFIVNGTVLMSDRSFKTIFPASAHRDRIEVGVVRLTQGADPAVEAQRLQATLPNDVRILTRRQFVDLEARFQAETTSVGPIFTMGVVFGFIVGMVISYQVLFSELSEQRAQYATLKAMGYDNRTLLGVVLRQSVFYAVAGFVPALLLSLVLARALAEVTLLPMRVSIGMAGLALVLALAMCLLAGLLAVRRVMAADPAEVF